MASTNAIVKKPTTTTTTGTKTTTSSSSAGSNVSSPTKAASTSTPTSATQGANTGLFSGLSLASFLGLPAVIDYQDIAIRVGLVVTGVILLILVAWAFVRGKQTTQVNIQAPSTSIASPRKYGSEAATEAEVAA